MFPPSMKTKMDDLEARKAELENKLTALPEQDPIVLHPVLTETYRAKLTALAGSLNQEAGRSEAF